MTKITLIYVLILFFTFSLMGCNVNDSHIEKENETKVMNSPSALTYEEEPETLATDCNDGTSSASYPVGTCWYLKTATLESPSNNELTGTNVTFEILKPSDQIGQLDWVEYTLHLKTYVNGNLVQVFRGDFSSSQLTVTNLERDKRYYWFVRSRHLLGRINGVIFKSKDSSQQNFRVKPPSPSLSGSINGGSPKLTFNKPAQYNVEIDRISDITPHSGTDTGFEVITNGSGSMSYTDHSHYVNLQLSQSFGFTNATYSIRYINSQGWSSEPSNFVVFTEESDGGFGF